MGRVIRNDEAQLPAGVHRLLNELDSAAPWKRARQLVLEEKWVDQLGHVTLLGEEHVRVLR